MPPPAPARLSIELTNRCGKACWFCYNHSSPAGRLAWDPDESVSFVTDCSAHGVRGVSFGGGEPLQHYVHYCAYLTDEERNAAGRATANPPYRRLAARQHPLRLEHLPAALGAEAARVRLPAVRFADAPFV